MAGLAKGYHCEVATLFDVVCIRWAIGAADRARLLLHEGNPSAFILCVGAVHVTALSNALLEAS